VSNPVIRVIGDSSDKKQRSWIVAAISPANPPVRGASWLIIKRPVLVTDLATVSESQGSNVHKSMTSQEIPSFVAIFAAR